MITLAAKGTVTRPIIRGIVVDMPSATVYIVKTDHGFFYVHDSEILSISVDSSAS